MPPTVEPDCALRSPQPETFTSALPSGSANVADSAAVISGIGAIGAVPSVAGVPA